MVPLLACTQHTLQTTHTQAIEAPALAVMVPLLVRGLRESTAIQRKCCVIVTNMAKLVNSPLDAAHFLPALVPGELPSRVCVSFLQPAEPAACSCCAGLACLLVNQEQQCGSI